MRNRRRKIEIFSAGCVCCQSTLEEIKKAACPSCEITIEDMMQTEVAERAKSIGIRSVPAVVIDGKLADCCTARGPSLESLRAAGLGVSL